MRTRTTLLSSNNITVNPWVHTLYLLILHVSTIALAAALLELLFARRRGHSVGQVLLQCSKRVGDKGGVREDLLHVSPTHIAWSLDGLGPIQQDAWMGSQTQGNTAHNLHGNIRNALSNYIPLDEQSQFMKAS